MRYVDENSPSTKPDHQAVEFRPNPLEDDVMGRAVVYFCGLQNHTVDTKSTRRDISSSGFGLFALA